MWSFWEKYNRNRNRMTYTLKHLGGFQATCAANNSPTMSFFSEVEIYPTLLQGGDVSSVGFRRKLIELKSRKHTQMARGQRLKVTKKKKNPAHLCSYFKFMFALL